MTNYLQQKTLYLPQVRRRAARNLGMCIVIPAYDEPFLIRTLMNLQKCDLPTCAVEVLVIINNGEHASKALLEKNRAIYLQTLEWAKENFKPLLRFHILFHDDLPKPFANADLARKIGMDEAVFRLEKANKKPGIIAVLDADARVEKNYFTALEAHFRRRSVPRVCMTDFTFPTFGIDFEDKFYEVAQQFELHLHYLNTAWTYLGLPTNFSILPGSFATDVRTYQKLGGWTSAVGRSKLLQEVHFLKNTCVTVSPRPSKRNPGGTSDSIQASFKNQNTFTTYHPETFAHLSTFLKANSTIKSVILKELKACPACVLDYFTENQFVDCELNGETFLMFFAHYHLDKYLEYAHQKHYKKLAVQEATQILLNENLALGDFSEHSVTDLLSVLKAS